MKTTCLRTSLKLTVAIVLAAPCAGKAAPLASETFETYSPGALSGQGGGSGWTGNWTAPGNVTRASVVDTTSNPLSFTPAGGATITGATRALEVQLSGAAASQLAGVRTLTTPIAQTFYVGYLVRYTGSGAWAGGNNTFTLHLGTNNNSTTTLNFGLRGDAASATANEFVVRHATAGPVTGASTGGQLQNATNYFLVARMNYSGGAFTSANMWLNPAADGETTTPNGNCSTNGFSSGPITHLFFRQAVLDSDDILQADEVKLGTLWSDVVTQLTSYPQVRVETAANGSGIVVPAQGFTPTNSITVYAVARDGGGTFITNPPVAWSLVNVTGGIGGGDLVSNPDGRSAVFTAHLAGTANIRANTPATNLVDSGTLTVSSGPVSQVRVETAANGAGSVVPAQLLTPGSTVTVYAISRDVGGNFLANVSANWSLVNKTSGVLDSDLSPTIGPSSTFTANLSGTVNIRAVATGLSSVDSGLLTISRTVTWVGGGANNWDFVTANWTTGSPTVFFDKDTVIFDGSGSQSPPVNLMVAVNPQSVNITDGIYTIGGPGKISGSAAVTNATGNVLTLLSSNDYTGPTVVPFGGLQLGNGVSNGSFGTGDVRLGAGGIPVVFNRTDPVGSPYVVTSRIWDGGVNTTFTIEVKSGAVKLAGTDNNTRAQAVVRSGATLILANTIGATIGNATDASGATVLDINSGGTVKLEGLQPVANSDHITGAGKVVQIDGTFDANGVNEAFGVIQGSGIIDNTASSNAVLIVNQGAASFGQGGEIFTFNGLIRNTGGGFLGITKDSTNTLVLAGANTYGGDTRVIGGGVLESGNTNSIQNSTLDYPTADIGRLSFGSLTAATLGGLKGAKGLGLTNSSGASIALTIGGNGQSNTYSGVLSGGGNLIKAGTGAQTLSGTNNYTGTTTVSAGALLVNGALGSGNVTVASGAALGGTGTIGGATTVQNGGRLSPGTSIGTLTVNNSATLQGGSITIMEINRTNAVASDKLVANSIALGGSLIVTNIGPSLASGNSFTLFTGSLSGSISPSSLPPLPPGLSWDTSLLNSAGTISVIGAALSPQISSLSISGGNFTFSGSGGSSGATYYVLNSTNVATPLASWARVATNSFAADGRFTNSIAFNSAAPQNYFTIAVP